jgi:hypothetical protein
VPSYKKRTVPLAAAHGAFVASSFFHICILGLVGTLSFSSLHQDLLPKKLVVSSIHLRPLSPSVAINKTMTFSDVAFDDKPQSVEEPASPVVKNPQEKVEEVVSSQNEEKVKPGEKKSVSKDFVKQVNKKAVSTAPVKKKIQSVKKPTSSKKVDQGVDKKLLQKILKNLDQSKAYGSTSQKGGAVSGKAQVVGKVGTLEVDRGVPISMSDDEFPGGEFGENSPEAYYIADLIRRLQLRLRLSEPGEVRLKLTLQRTGAVTNVEFIRTQKESSKRFLREKLDEMIFAPFGSGFKGQKEHTFVLRLTHDLVWTYGR